MQSYWDPERKHRVYPIDAPPDASRRERQQFRENLKRNARVAEGRCPYCGRYPEPGETRCVRCLELQRIRNARAIARRRERREAEKRAAQPRRCTGCGADLTKSGHSKAGRPTYRCNGCGRCSTGDGPPTRPENPCPYCGGHCRKNGRRADGAKHQIFRCSACGRSNTGLWPDTFHSSGGPFPHMMTFNFTYPAKQALMDYCQEKMLSIPQAIRDIFTRAGHAPLTRITSSSRIYDSDGRANISHTSREIHSALPLPEIPPGGIRLPSARPEAVAKLAKMRNGASRYNPSIAVALYYRVGLNDAALAGLLETMRRRQINHQDAARALIIETVPRPQRSASRYYDPDEGWH